MNKPIAVNLPDTPPTTPSCFQPPALNELRERLRRLLEDGNGAELAAALILVVIYIRVSSEMQLDGTSMDDQRSRCTSFIQSQGPHWSLLECIEDPAESGRSGKRPGFVRLKKLIREGRVQVLVVDRIDRLARHLPTFLEFIDLLRRHNVKLVSLREGIDYRKPWGKLVLYILGALAEFYSDNLSQEMRVKRITDAANGKLAPTFRLGYCIGNCSTCTDPNGANYCPHFGGPDQRGGYFRIAHPIESVAVQLMFEWYSAGDMSFADIAHRLNGEIFALPDGTEVRFRTKGRVGVSPPNRFDADAVREILSNPIYTGCVTYAGSTSTGVKVRKSRDVFPGKGLHPALVDPMTFERVQQLRKSRYARPDSKANPARAFPLARILVCAHRHGPVRSQSVTGHRYYIDRVCQLKWGEKHQPNIPADVLETQVRDVVGQIQLPEAWLRRTLAYVLYDEGEAAIIQDRLALHKRLEAETYLLRQGIISTAEFQRRRTQITTALAALEPTGAPISQEAMKLLQNLRLLLETMAPETENALYQTLFTSVIVDQQRVVGMEVYPAFLPLHPQFTLPGTHEPHLGPYPVP